jgi:hypothetical protein
MTNSTNKYKKVKLLTFLILSIAIIKKSDEKFVFIALESSPVVMCKP